MTDRPLNVLFLCTGNSCRSSLAEQLLNHLGQGRFVGYSAGSTPTGRVNPHAVLALQRRGVDPEELTSKSWNEFGATDATVMDIVITVCDNARGEVCPIWPGHPVSAHWGLSDPADFKGNDAEVAAVFDATLNQLERLIGGLLELTEDKRTREGLEQLRKELTPGEA
jgi:arsenate reductase